MSERHVTDLLPAYALGATAGAECATVEAHVASCASCRAELDELQRDVALLAEVAPAQPPAHLRANVLAHIDAAECGDVEERTTNPPQASMPEPAPVGMPSVRSHRRWSGITVPMFAAAALLLAVVAGVQTLRVSDLRGELADARRAPSADERTSAAQLVADEVRRIETNGRLASAVANVGLREGAGAMLMLQQMPEPPVTKSWQVWVIDADGTKRSLSVMDHAAPVAVLALPEDVDVQAVAITLERAGGANQPTTAPLAYGEMQA